MDDPALTKSDADIIKDFKDGEDKLALEDGLTFDDLLIGTFKGKTTIFIKDTYEFLAVLDGIAPKNLTSEDFTTLEIV